MNNKMQIYPENTDSNLTLQKIIDLNIKKCKCIRKIQSENDPSICGCGKSISLHDTDETTVKKKESYLKRLDSIMEPNIGYDEKWSADKCTRRDGYTNAFGEVKFLGYNENTAKYIRIHYETGMDTVLKMLYDKEYWNLKPPRLIISVTGGAKLTLKKQLKISFSKGLVKVATTTNALITSGGSYSGCMKIVGEAFKENALSMDFSSKVNLLGIRNWGSVTNNHLLINTDKKPLSIKEYELVKPKNSVKSELLDPNHSHYLLVDDATNVFGNEVKFRTLLESEMSKKFNNIPIVVLVVGGGPRTVNTVFESLEKETPCVFLESSGESSDIFVFALKKIEDLKRKEFKLCDQNEKFKLPKEFHDEIKTKFKSEYSKKSENEIDKMADCMSQCLNPKYSHLLTVCQSQNSKSEIDVAILNALLRAVKQEKKDEKKEENKTKKSHKKGTTHAVSEDENNKYQKQLHLALDWNRADIARKFIFTDELSDKIGSLNDLMFRAINENRIEFVKLFLEKGFNLKSFLTYRVLFKLYNSISQNSPLFKLLNQYKKGKVNFKLEHQEHLHLTDNKYTFKNIGLVIQYLVNDQFHHKFTKEPFNIINSNECEKILKDTQKYGKMVPCTIGIFSDVENNLSNINIDDKFMAPENELFMYSVLLGRSEMAKLFCSIGVNSIASALIAKIIFDSFAYKFEESFLKYKEFANDYEELACNILNAYYVKDEEKAKFALIRKLDEYDNRTTMQLAVASKSLSIMAHQSFQNVLNMIWLNKLNPDLAYFKFGISLFCPFLAPLILSFQKEHVLNTKNDEETPAESEQIEYENEFEFVLKNTNDLDSKNIKIERESTYLKKLYYFITTPVVKFSYFQISYLLFLILFSYVILCDFYPIGYNMSAATSLGLPISILEILLIIWVGLFLLEEIRAFHIDEIKVFKARFKSFVSDTWNLSVYAAIFIFIVGLILRFIPDYNCYLAARILWCIDIILWFIKSLNAYSLNRNLGPKLLMIQKMLPQLGYFLLIVVLFMFAFGISTQSLLYHNSPLNIQLLSNVFFPAFWVIGGEYYTRDLIMNPTDPNNCNPTNQTDLYVYQPGDCPNEVGANVTLAIYVFYLILLNILLVNLLIAIFNNTYQSIEKQAYKISKSQRYSIVFEFYYKPILPPPLVAISYLLGIVIYCVRSLRKFLLIGDENKKSYKDKNANYVSRLFRFVTKKRPTGFVYEFSSPNEKNKIVKWESYNTDEFIYMKEKEEEKKLEYKLEQNVEKIDILCCKFDELINNEYVHVNDNKIQSIYQSLNFLLAKFENESIS